MSEVQIELRCNVVWCGKDWLIAKKKEGKARLESLMRKQVEHVTAG
jgi:hypothetical protein